MYQNLEAYLREIGHYLAVQDGANDILSEIKSHLLEKTEAEFGTVTEDTVGRIISSYGRPQQIAAKYTEGIEIISPIFRRHLFLYTGILSLCHSVMAFIAWQMNISLMVIPFLYIPKMDGWQILFYLPMAFIYDIGLVVIFLYFVTQHNKEARLPWPKVFPIRESRKELKAPKVAFMTFLVLILASFLFFFFRYGTIFLASMTDIADPVPMFGPSASQYYSGLFLAMLGCEVIGYAARFVTGSRWIQLIKTAAILFLLQFVWNSPVPADFIPIRGLNVEHIATVLLLVFTVLIVMRLLVNLVSVSRSQFNKKEMADSYGGYHR